MPMKPPQLGQMRFRLRFERRAPAENVGGVVKGDWVPIAGAESRAASVVPTTAGDTEANIAGRMTGKVRYDVWVRGEGLLRGLTAADRAVNIRTGEIYNLGQAVDPIGDNRWLFVQATSAGNARAEG